MEGEEERQNKRREKKARSKGDNYMEQTIKEYQEKTEILAGRSKRNNNREKMARKLYMER